MPLIMHRTRNLGVTGVKGQYTVGPFVSRDNQPEEVVEPDPPAEPDPPVEPDPEGNPIRGGRK